MEKCLKHYVLVTMYFQSSKEKKFTDHFHKFHIPLGVKNFLFEKVKKVDAHRNVQVKYYSVRSAGGDFFSLVYTLKVQVQNFCCYIWENFFYKIKLSFLCTPIDI